MANRAVAFWDRRLGRFTFAAKLPIDIRGAARQPRSPTIALMKDADVARFMAESKRKVGDGPTADEEAQEKRDRITLIVMLVGGVLIVAGMIWLSKFLSGS